MPIVQKYRECKCTNDCFEHFYESCWYYYLPLLPSPDGMTVGVLGPNEDELYIMSEELFWQNFTDPKREHRHRKV